MLDKIYTSRQYDMEEESKQDREKLKGKINDVKIGDIKELVLDKKESKIEETNKIITNLEMLTENYEIKMAYYNEKNYKQGFSDAVKLYTECLTKK